MVDTRHSRMAHSTTNDTETAMHLVCFFCFLYIMFYLSFLLSCFLCNVDGNSHPLLSFFSPASFSCLQFMLIGLGLCDFMDQTSLILFSQTSKRFYNAMSLYAR